MKFEFWEDWPKPLQKVFYLFFSLFAAAIIYTVICSIIGYQLVIDWEMIGQRLPLKVVIDQIDLGAFQIPIQTDNYVITQWYQGSDIEVNLFATYFFLAITVIALVIGLASATFLGRTLFYVLTIVFVATLLFFKFDAILLFGLSDNTTLILVIATYLGLAYVFYNVRTDFDFLKRLTLLLALTVFWVIIIFFFSEVEKPFVLLASNGFLVPYLIGIIFIFAVAHEIIHFIVVALTKSGSSSGNNLAHFTLFSIIYLANVLILFLHDTYVIDWNFYYLNPYVLAAVSTVLGLWGLQSRVTLFNMEKQLYPVVVYLYLAGAICAFGTIFYFLGNANDPILLVVKDAIIYSHLGFGSIFFIYVISNFMGMLRGNLKVYQVIYKPRNMPHFIFRFAGLIVVTAFFLKEDINTSVFQTLSGMFNNQGDYYKVIDDKINAETYYSNGALYGYMNHKSNYSLAKLYESNSNTVDAIIHFDNATKLRPSEMAFVNLGNIRMSSGDFFSSLFTLNDGLAEYPSGKAILNNKGLLFSKTSISDSALLYFDASYRAGRKEEVPVVNFLAVLSLFDYGLDPDSLVENYRTANSAAIRSNVLLIRNLQNNEHEIEEDEYLESKLNIYSASAQANYIINQYRNYDTSYFSRQLEIANLPENGKYVESLELALAMAAYKRGNINEAIRLLRELSVYSGKSQLYNYLTGLVLMKIGHYREAVDYLDIALAAGNNMAASARQLCLIELGQNNPDSLKNIGSDSPLENLGGLNEWSTLVSLSPSEFSNLDDEDRYIYLHYNYGQIEVEQILEMSSTIGSNVLKAKCFLDGYFYYFKKGEYTAAEKFVIAMDNISEEATIGEDLENEIIEAKLSYAAHNGDIEVIRSLLSEVSWISYDKHWYYQALLAEGEGKEEEAARYFEVAVEMNSFQEEAVLAAANFFKDHENNMKSYDILVNALLQNPHSVKLLKGYIREAYNKGLISYAQQALGNLEEILEAREMEAYRNSLENISQNPDLD